MAKAKTKRKTGGRPKPLASKAGVSRNGKRAH